MRYSIVQTVLAKRRGFIPIFHRMNSDGTQMIVNENELLTVDEDVEKAAKTLGGELLGLSELNKKIKEWQHE